MHVQRKLRRVRGPQVSNPTEFAKWKQLYDLGQSEWQSDKLPQLVVVPRSTKRLRYRPIPLETGNRFIVTNGSAEDHELVLLQADDFAAECRANAQRTLDRIRKQ